MKISTLLFALLIAAESSFAQETGKAKDNFLTRIFSGAQENYSVEWANYSDFARSNISHPNTETRKNALLVFAFDNLYQNKRDSALKYFKLALEADSTCYQCFIKLHWLYYYSKNDYKNTNKISRRAIACYEKIYQKDSVNPITCSRLYNIYGLREYDNSVAKKKREDQLSLKLVTLQPDNPYYLWQHSFHCPDSQKERYLLAAFSIEPSQPVYWNALAYCYYKKKDIEKCMEVIQKVESLENHSAYWFQQKAFYLKMLGKVKEAKAVKIEAKKFGHNIVY
jgi:tetratricopeptide (TPR) repeat protein